MSIHRGLLYLLSQTTRDNREKKVSLIIPFRNEENNLRENIESVQKLNYPENLLEVIYVDDNSTDGSLKILNEFRKNEFIKIIKMSEDFKDDGSKKRAVEFAVSMAKGEIIVTSDADCVFNENWLMTISQQFDGDTGFVAGPVDMLNAKNFFQKIQRLEFIGLILSGAGLIGLNKPTICSAANIAFKKNVFESIGGYGKTHKFTSGDDELLMQKIAAETKYKIKFNFNRDAVVLTTPLKKLSDFFEQRKRWASKGVFYKSKLLVLNLILIYLFYLSLIVNFVLGLVVNDLFLLLVIFQLTLKMLLEYRILRFGTTNLFDKKILNVFLPAQFFQIPYILLSAFLGLFGGIKWKGRVKPR